MARGEIKTSVVEGELVIVTEVGEIRVNPNALQPEILDTAILHGLKQKICDAAAIPVDPETGKSASIADKHAAMGRVWQNLINGEWSVRGTGTGAAGGLLFRALCRLYPAKTHEAVREFLAGKSKIEQAALRKNPKIAAIIDEILTEGADIDTDELLNELE